MSALLSGLRDRSLDPYPANARRIWYLALTVIATITLYYQLYMLASVAPLVQADFHLSLSHYVYSLILANILGGMAAYIETVEDTNPALVATGIAVWVFIVRWVTVISTLALPIVVGNGQSWGSWWWICVAGQVVFLPTVLTASGHWNPAHSRAQERAENVEVQPNVG